MQVNDALQFATRYLSDRQLHSPRRDAELLLITILNRDRSFLYSHPEYGLSARQEEVFHQWLARRGEHFPLQYLRGKQEFFGRDFVVRPGVFIPRPETELIVETALELLAGFNDDALYVAEVGTGSGCIAVSLAAEHPAVRVAAVDISEAALQAARQNAEVHGCLDRLELLLGDTLVPLAERRAHFHLIVSNPPYIAEAAALDPSVDRYEPPQALFAGPDGDRLYARILAQARELLHSRGRLVIEIAPDLRASVTDRIEEHGWRVESCLQDLAGLDRCLVLSSSGSSSG